MVAGLSACGVTPPPDPLPPPPPFSGTLGSSAVDLVTFSGTWSTTQRILDSAIERLNQRCLAAQGFDYPIGPTPPPPPADDDAIIDLPGRRSHGYGLAEAPISGDDQPPPAADAYVDTLSPEQQNRFRTALFGPPDSERTIDLPDGSQVTIPEQGCQADSRTQLAGDITRWAHLTYIPEYFYNRMATQLRTTPGYGAALTTWQICMATRGYRYQTPEQAWQALKSEITTATEEFRQREIATAIADGECASHARLPSAALAARRELVTTMPEADRKTLHDLAHYRDAVVERAESVR
ncbi:hypothetical protein [Nocardia transvalensis]|uniref:hypothetical protein n=1 Tax=Nocardia transvalensis TaxID=37333 RepID=UPI001892EB07|nr:hypothetical protein [Nocardia transvalensis]MBF6328170.1 hypothetical protein [Nocardia transvalensis]